MPTTTETPTPKPGEAPPAPAPSGVQVGQDQMLARMGEADELEAMCESRGLSREDGRAIRNDFIKKGQTMKEAKAAILDKIATHDAGRLPSAESLETLGVGKKDLKKYRYSAAIAQALANHNSGEYEGLEGEMHRLLLTRRPEKMAEHGGIFVPFDLRSDSEIAAAEERRLTAHTMAANQPGKGLELVGETRMQLVELLQAKPMCVRLGATQNFGLTAPLSYPRITGGPTVVFQGENPASDAAESDLVTGEILSTGRQTIGGIPLSRGLILQTGGAAESYARQLLTDGEALVVDRAVFAGIGAGSQPTGLYFTPTVQTVAMGSVTPTYDKITQMIAAVARQNAAYGTMGWFTSPEIAAKLMITPEISAAGAKPIWTGTIEDGLIAGYRAVASTQTSITLGSGADEHGFGFGNWANCHVNRWGAIEVLVDPYTSALRALIKLRTYGMADAIFTQPQGFCVGTAAKAA